jgi:hypothetical protein
MSASKYFFQGFLFMFGLCSVPFLKEVKAENKLASYWDKVSSRIHTAFNAETSKATR